MVAPIKINDPEIAKAYRALTSRSQLGAKDADGLIAAARRDDGRIDKTEAADLNRIASANPQLFDPATRQRLARIAADPDGPRSPAPRLLPVPQQPLGGGLTQSRPRQDATWVARTQPSPHQRGGRSTLPAPPRHEISAAPPMTPERQRALKAAENRRKAQENVNGTANLDPVAARINGMYRQPNGNWTEVSPSPLHIGSSVAFGYSVPGRIYNGVVAGKAVVNAVQDPTAGNVGSAALKVGLTAAGEWAGAVHAPIKTPIAVTKGGMNAWNESKTGKK